MKFTIQELDYILSWAATCQDIGDEWPTDEEALLTKLSEERARLEQELDE